MDLSWDFMVRSNEILSGILDDETPVISHNYGNHHAINGKIHENSTGPCSIAM